LLLRTVVEPDVVSFVTAHRDAGQTGAALEVAVDVVDVEHESATAPSPGDEVSVADQQPHGGGGLVLQVGGRLLGGKPGGSDGGSSRLFRCGHRLHLLVTVGEADRH